ncbi:hypothetical protein CYMTET_21072 [Cymbomonas tetramitiformis]|uniref:Uncharacterized protein n=1 Tax=Cymbomonas tetramitiformis TaxID=36881 RepID=A0AAE0G2V3_9CHLO|nr:hypothetical protein CYMTET_21072 [Cymbomonas tetramitiformis]
MHHRRTRRPLEGMVVARVVEAEVEVALEVVGKAEEATAVKVEMALEVVGGGQGGGIGIGGDGGGGDG